MIGYTRGRTMMQRLNIETVKQCNRSLAIDILRQRMRGKQAGNERYGYKMRTQRKECHRNMSLDCECGCGARSRLV